MKVWQDQVADKHFWAFYYYCKRQGDSVTIFKQSNGKYTLIIHEAH